MRQSSARADCLYIETRPKPCWLMSMGIMKGEGGLSPAFEQKFMLFPIVVASPPMPEPMMTPIRRNFPWRVPNGIKQR